MQAFHLTKAISSILNEDKFSKYTALQIYDELGKEDFIEYLENALIKIVNKIELFKDAETDKHVGTLSAYFYFIRDMPRYSEILTIKVYPVSGLIAIASEIMDMGSVPNIVIERNSTNIVKLLQDNIIKIVNSKKMVKMRKAAESI
jgi:hypothetical protein